MIHESKIKSQKFSSRNETSRGSAGKLLDLGSWFIAALIACHQARAEFCHLKPSNARETLWLKNSTMMGCAKVLVARTFRDSSSLLRRPVLVAKSSAQSSVRYSFHRQHQNLFNYCCFRSSSGKNETMTKPGLWVRRFLNPWMDALGQGDPVTLSERIRRYTEVFAVVSTLLCALSAAALTNIPQDYRQRELNVKAESMIRQETVAPKSSALTSVLQQSQLLPDSAAYGSTVLHDAYTISCCSSFFAGACALGLSTVLNVVGTVAPRKFIQKGLILRHSLALSSIPFLAVTSGGFMGLTLIVGIDMTVCSPSLTYVAMGQLCFTILLVAGTALRAQIGLVRAITAAADRASKANRRLRRSGNS